MRRGRETSVQCERLLAGVASGHSGQRSVQDVLDSVRSGRYGRSFAVRFRRFVEGGSGLR